MGCRILPNIESRASQRTIDAGHDLEQLGGVLEQTDAHPAFAHLTEADPGISATPAVLSSQSTNAAESPCHRASRPPYTFWTAS